MQVRKIEIFSGSMPRTPLATFLDLGIYKNLRTALYATFYLFMLLP